MRKLPKIDLRKKKRFKNMVNKPSCHKYKDSPFIYFDNNSVEIINIKKRKEER